ncbi:5,6-dimethylbenzimidazole synthase [Kribbella sp. ALI-6-A]|uniref:5,6-dimethylbenzimidazole synthase n=1 Tax=Kribbella sp. ALI-6-A TaxID=1933817 RepID=UPI00097C5A63|nr:5,6-dimethylbenzimidazole synthase [Kribbella sp. ALI-6-A]ONI69496.1 5,6-dimethylbenzimidazole synthase [Kribbella sp. ALI-6-A]
MTLVLGIGVRAGTPYRELRDLVNRALAGQEGSVGSVVTVQGRESEPGLQRLVASLNAQLLTATSLELAEQVVPTPSDQVGQLAGTASVAEAAVVLSGAELVVPKLKSPGATVAVGRLNAVAAPGYSLSDREVVHRVIAERRDVRRGFLDKPVDDELLTRVLEAAHRAPSVGLSQPWDFLLVRDVATRRKIHDLASAQRDAFAASLPADRRSAFDGLKIEAILDTPLNIAVTCDPGRGGRHVLGRHADPRTVWFSAAIAVQNLWLAARAEGLGVGWVSFFEPGEVAAVLGLPAHVDLVGYLCVGHVSEFGAAPELVRSGWAARRPLAWAVHQEQWGQRGLPGEEPSPAVAVQAAVAAAESPERVASGRQVVRVRVVDGGEVAEHLGDADVLVVQVGTERPAADFGVLWRPARTADEAVELGVEVARDLVLQGAGKLLVECVAESEIAERLTQGIRWGALACGAVANGQDEPETVSDSSA